MTNLELLPVGHIVSSVKEVRYPLLACKFVDIVKNNRNFSTKAAIFSP